MARRTSRTVRPVSGHVTKYFWHGTDFTKTLESDRESISLSSEREHAVQEFMKEGLTRDQALERLDGRGQKKLWMLEGW